MKQLSGLNPTLAVKVVAPMRLKDPSLIFCQSIGRFS